MIFFNIQLNALQEKIFQINVRRYIISIHYHLRFEILS